MNPASSPISPISPISAATSAGGQRVLVVDDDVLTRTLIASLLKRAGYEVTATTDGTSALALSAAAPPDLVLLDYLMPGMNGPDVARRMREQRAMRDVPILLLTASELESHIEEGVSAGVDDYLIKPIDRRVLVTRVETALRESEDRRRAAAAEASTIARDGSIT